MCSDILLPSEEEIEAFWVRARTRGKIYPLEAIIGQEAIISLCPPAFALGDTREKANELASLVVEGKKTATSSWLPSYQKAGEDIPEAGDLNILCDGEGLPQALVRNTRVDLCAFEDVDTEVALAEGEGDLAEWIEDHREFFAQEMKELYGAAFDPQGTVVIEHFEVLYVREVQA